MNGPSVDSAIHRIRLHLASPGVTKKGFAEAAGLHPNTLQGVEREDWNPTADTIRALEAQLPLSVHGAENAPDAGAVSGNNGGGTIPAADQALGEAA